MGDLRHAWRSLRRAPWYSVTIAAVLAIGMSLATTVFAIVDGVLFKPLPYPASSELFLISGQITSAARTGVSVAARDVEEWRAVAPQVRFAASGTLTGLGTLGVINGPNIWSLPVDREYLDVLGVRPLVGGFSAADFEAAPVTPGLITHRLWRHRFGADAAVIGTTINFGGHHVRIAGVLPEGFMVPRTGRTVDVLTPLIVVPEPGAGRGSRYLDVIARVPSGTPLPRLRDQLSQIMRASQRDYPGIDPARLSDAADIRSLAATIGQNERPRFKLVLGAVSVVLLLVAVNVAGLVSSRNVDRLRDLAIRRALGASSASVARGLIAELAVLATAGGAAGILLAWPLLRITLSILPENLVLLRDPVVDGRVLALVLAAAAAVVACVTLLIFHRLRTATLTAVIGQGAGAPSHRSSSLGTRLVITAQIALGLVLLVAGTLLVRSVMRVWDEDPGFEVDRAIRLDVRFASREALVDRTRGLLEVLRGVPGVRSAAALDAPFLARATRGNPFSSLDDSSQAAVEAVGITGGFFEAMGMAAIDGRLPSDSEIAARAPVAVVSERAARVFWRSQAAVGQTLSARAGVLTVVGVVRDARFLSLEGRSTGQIYLPHGWDNAPSWPTVIVRTHGSEGPVVPRLIDAARRFDPSADVRQARTMTDSLAETIRFRRFQAWFFSAFAVAATVVVGTGVLGLLAMTTARRTREVGIRMALGATPGRIIAQFLREQLLTVSAGLVTGSLASAWLVRFLRTSLYETSVADVGAWLSAMAALMVVAGIGALLPSARAARVNPVHALRVS